jgi:putative restriction endonuclease
MVLNNYCTKCCITGIEIPGFLIASHIVPWSINEKERLNPRNGICLNALHDKAFDQGLITITPNFEVKLSSKLLESNISLLEYFIKYDKQKISIPTKFIPSEEFLEYHNNNIFSQ